MTFGVEFDEDEQYSGQQRESPMTRLALRLPFVHNEGQANTVLILLAILTSVAALVVFTLTTYDPPYTQYEGEYVPPQEV